MAKVNTVSFHYSDDNMHKVKWSVDVTVDRDGVFSLRIPDFLDEFIRREAEDQRFYNTSAFGLYNHGELKYARGSDMAALIRRIEAYFDSYSAPDIQRELVIKYNITGDVSVFIGERGDLYPNGTGAGPGSWFCGRISHSASNAPYGFSVCVGARVLVKIKKTRGVTETIHYSEYEDEFSKLAPPAVKDAFELNKFICAWKGSDQEIPYTKEAEQFFIKAMLEIARVATALETFGANKAAVLEAISARAELPLDTTKAIALVA